MLIYEGSRLTRRAAHDTVLAVVVGLGLPDTKVDTLLRCINLFCPEPVFATTETFFNFFKYNETSTYLVCTIETCSGPVTLADTTEYKCELCRKTYTKSELINERSYFKHNALAPQIVNLMNNAEIITEIEKYKKETGVNSVINSSQYKFLKLSGKISANDVTLQINTDGVAATKASKLSFWPVLVSINELPLKLRTENMMLLSVWMGKSKPNMETFLAPVVEELKELSLKGVNTDIGVVKVHCILCSVDSPARADLMKLLFPGGSYACPWCFRRAKSVHKGKGTTRVFKHKRLRKRRDVKNYLQFAKLRFVDGLFHCKGVKGVSPLANIPNFDVINGFVVEYMHALCIGVFNQYLEAFVGAEFAARPWSLRKKMEKADELMKKITPPHEITRLPEPLSAFKGMKASVKKNMFCYYLIPILKALDVPQEYVNNAFLLVYFFRKFLQTSLTRSEAAKARACLFKFHSQLAKLFNIKMMTFNMHITSHIPDMCEMWGGLWDCSTFSYEGKNGLLAKLHHGTVFQNDQILRNFQRLQIVKESDISKSNYDHKEVHEVYKSAMGGKKETLDCERVHNCYLLNCGRNQVLRNDVLRGIQKEIPQSVLLSEAKLINRFIINGIVSCTKKYVRMKKRRNYVFKTSDSRYFAVHELYLCSLQDGEKVVYSVGVYLNKNNEKLAWDDEHQIDSTDFLDSITADSEESFINVELLQEKMFCFDVQDKTFVTPLVNIREGD
jgi:hypothetical protein